MKILLIQHLHFINGSGGTEKVCSFLANNFAQLGHQVVIATCQNILGKPFFPLHHSVKVSNIYTPNIAQYHAKELYNYKGRNPLLWLMFKILKKKDKVYNYRLYKKLNGKDGVYLFNLKERAQHWQSYIHTVQPDVIITMSVSSVLEITYQNKLNIPIINSTNGRPDYDYTNVLGYRSLVEMQQLKSCFQHITATQILFSSYKNFLPTTFKGICTVIANPAPQVADAVIVNHTTNKKRYKIIQIASLVLDCKQQHISLEVFSNIAHQHPNWDLFFWGKGEDQATLTAQIEKAGLQNRAFLMGLTNDPLKELQEADIFIFPSRYEGLPLALTEALSIGLPALGFKNCSGVNEIIKHNQNGFLAADVAEMQQQLAYLITHPEVRQQFGKAGHEQMKAFAPDKIFRDWQNLVLCTNHPTT